MPIPPPTKQHLGDGVYISPSDVNELVLTTENGLEDMNVIFLDGSVAWALLNYLSHHFAAQRQSPTQPIDPISPQSLAHDELRYRALTHGWQHCGESEPLAHDLWTHPDKCENGATLTSDQLIEWLDEQENI